MKKNVRIEKISESEVKNVFGGCIDTEHLKGVVIDINNPGGVSIPSYEDVKNEGFKIN